MAFFNVFNLADLKLHQAIIHVKTGDKLHDLILLSDDKDPSGHTLLDAWLIYPNGNIKICENGQPTLSITQASEQDIIRQYFEDAKKEILCPNLNY